MRLVQFIFVGMQNMMNEFREKELGLPPIRTGNCGGTLVHQHHVCADSCARFSCAFGLSSFVPLLWAGEPSFTPSSIPCLKCLRAFTLPLAGRDRDAL